MLIITITAEDLIFLGCCAVSTGK